MPEKPHMDLQTARRINKNFRLLALAAFGMIILGTFVMHYLEKLSYVKALYFSVVSLTTVGYGDIVPITDAGRLFVCFYLLAGIGIIAAFASTLIQNAVAKRIIKKAQKQ